jgi:hypothetical protein
VASPESGAASTLISNRVEAFMALGSNLALVSTGGVIAGNNATYPKMTILFAR